MQTPMNLNKTDGGIIRLCKSLNDNADGKVVICKVSVDTDEKLAIGPALAPAKP